MLAYLFWHSPADGADLDEYEGLLAAFHARLREVPPPGFRESVAFAPSSDSARYKYEDWYLVDDWNALGIMNSAAVDAARGPRHDPVARQAAKGAGGIYALQRGVLPITEVGSAAWSHKPPGLPHGTFETQLADGREPAEYALWQRQMVLGPAPEYCVLTAGEALRRVA